MAKFKEQNFFENTNEGYELLPFRFARINGRVLLTNIVGEYFFTKDEVLKSLVDGTLPNDSEDYLNLRSLHFICDDQTQSAKQLLGIKTRTKLSNYSNLTSLHMFVISLRCEHSCPYCQVSRQSDDKLAFDMSYETASKAVDFALSGPSPRIKIEFQGGEPLLNFDTLKFIVHDAKEKNETIGKDLSFVIATNLAVITDEILDYCKLHDIEISTSLDGPASLHNHNRPRPGNNSHELATQGIKKVREKLGFDKVNALMTTTDKSLEDPRIIIDEYLKHGFSGIFLRPLSPYGFAIKTKKYNAYGSKKWFEFYKSGLEYILEINKSGVHFREFYSATILKKILTLKDPGYVDLRSPAGIGIGGIVYNYDGKIFASDEGRMLAEMGDNAFEIGNLATDNFKDVFLSDKLLDPLEQSMTTSAPRCSECAFEQYCGADPVFHYATTGDFLGKKAESDFCYRNYNTFSHLLDTYDSNLEARSIFQSWIN